MTERDALEAEVARLTAERDTAEARGAKRMREQAARRCYYRASLWGAVYGAGCSDCAADIRALPLTEDAP